MNEPSPRLTRLLRAYWRGVTSEHGLSLALVALADAVTPEGVSPPADFDLEEWGRYSKQVSIRRQIMALAAELADHSQQVPLRPD